MNALLRALCWLVNVAEVIRDIGPFANDISLASSSMIYFALKLLRRQRSKETKIKVYAVYDDWILAVLCKHFAGKYEGVHDELGDAHKVVKARGKKHASKHICADCSNSFEHGSTRHQCAMVRCKS